MNKITLLKTKSFKFNSHSPRVNQKVLEQDRQMTTRLLLAKCT